MPRVSRIPICHVQLLPLMSGVQRVSLQIFDALDQDRFEPHVVLKCAGPFSEVLAERGIRTHFLPHLVRPIHPLRDALAYRDLYRLFQREQFQVVHTHCSKPGILGRIAARRAGVPLVMHHVHSIAFHKLAPAPVRELYRRSEQWAERFGDHTVFVNHADMYDSIARGIVPRKKCSVIYNGADLRRLQPRPGPRGESALRRSLGLDPDGMLIYFVARIERPKQPLLLPEIAVALERQLPDAPWKLVVAGEGSYDASLRRKISDMRMAHRFLLVGWHDDDAKRAMYAEADVVLQPSLWEGLSLTLIEAQAAGLPCVVGDVDGNREVVIDGTGFRCEPSNPEDYARRLEWLARRPQARAEMGRVARRHAERSFDVDANMRAVTAIYDELLPATSRRETHPVRRAA